MEWLSSIFWLIVTMTILIGFHEFGHFWVARRAGVKVTKFSIGFGPKLFSRFDRKGTEFQVSALPLGGYVKMTDTREGNVAAADEGVAFDRQSVWKRIAVVAAGPGANILLTLVIFWIVAMIGTPMFKPTVAFMAPTAASTGLQVGDTVTAIDGVAIRSTEDMQGALLNHAIDRTDAKLTVASKSGAERQITFPYSTISRDKSTPEAIGQFAFVGPNDLLPPIVDKVSDGSGAVGKLESGDRITRINGAPVQYWHEVSQTVAAATKDATSAPVLSVQVDRNGSLRDVSIPLTRAEDGRWIMGVAVKAEQGKAKPDFVDRLNPIAAIPAAFAQTWNATKLMGSMAAKAFSGKLELGLTVAGPVTTARVSNSVAKSGAAQYLKLLALLSLSVAILNLLPIPVLDGGHLLYYLIELVKGSPVSEKVQAFGNAIGLALVFSLMGLALFNDVLNNF